MCETDADEIQEFINISDEQIQYVLNDTEYILEAEQDTPESKTAFNDVVYSLVLDGDNLNQFYINNDSEQIFVDSNVDDSTPLDGTIIQYVHDEEAALDTEQVVYVADTNEVIPELPNCELEQHDQFQVNTGNYGESIKALFPNYIVDNEEILDVNENLENDGQFQSFEVDTENSEGYQFAILKDGKLYYIQANDNNDLTSLNNDFDITTVEENIKTKGYVDDAEDISNIFGKNLLTGQTVTLENYISSLEQKASYFQFSELKKKSTKRNKTSLKKKKADDLKKLLNTKINLGTTSGGKKLVGKVIHVEKKTVEKSTKTRTERNIKKITEVNKNLDIKKFEFLSNNQITIESGTESNEKPLKITTVSQECKEDVIKTLSGLMNMETVRNKLENKLITVMMIEKRKMLSGEVLKQTSYSRGILKDEEKENDEGETFTHWKYFAQEDLNEEQIELFKKETKDIECISIILIVSYEANGERKTRVVLDTPVIMPHCKICNVDFVSNFLLHCHIKNQHDNDPVSSEASAILPHCEICNKDFASNFLLHCHIKNFHKYDNDSLLCQVCTINLRNKAELNEHIEMHLNAGLLHQCEFCSKTFLSFDSVKQHIINCATAHVDDEELPSTYVCQLCNKHFCNKMDLKQHSFYHIKPRPHLCNVCGKAFESEQGLISHRRTHISYIRTKYFSCSVCNRNFSRQSNLQRHMEIHSGNGALYECSLCGCSYHYASSLTRHMVQNHLDVVTENAAHNR